MIIVIIGTGGRENLISEKLNNGINKLYCIGTWRNPDIIKNTIDLFEIDSLSNCEMLLDYCNKLNPDMIVVGPESVLDTNFVEECSKKGYKCIGPCKQLAKLETSKYFTREFLVEINEDFYNPLYFQLEKTNIDKQIKDFCSNNREIVIKVDNLASGKGVFVQGDHFDNIHDGISLIKNKLESQNVIIEEKLVGEEFSLFTLSDGENFIHLPPVQDYKRAYDDNKGPNTGGMGSIMCNFNFLNKEDIDKCELLNSKVLTSLKKKYDKKYIGILYGSYMKTVSDQIKLIEYNCRFGDSEVFNVLNSIETDLSEVFNLMTNGKLDKEKVKLTQKTNIVKYLVPEGYPDSPKKKKINYNKVKNVYAASLNESYKLLGSRSIAIYGEGENINEAYSNCESLINEINKDNLYWRKDIGLNFNKDTYKAAGVDVEKGNLFVKIIKKDVESTYNSNVLGKHGNFGGQFKFKNDVLVASTDGVGTKGIIIKKYTGSYYTCGHDIVNHSINDILVQGAKPLFFLDYVASSKLDIEDTSSFVKGCCDACKKVNCVLLGGETAEMPTVYNEGHMDMVGTIIGEQVLKISDMKNGDIAIGISSSGPHTNGYTLIRKILESKNPPSEVLDNFISPHRSYLNDVFKIVDLNYIITGLCHITGGGLTENLKRTIPNNLNINLDNIKYPNWCKWLQKQGNISDEEMKKTFNCGIGFYIFVRCVTRDRPLKIAIMGSTKGTVMEHIVNAINDSESLIYKKVDIVKVISNKKSSGILERSDRLGIPNEYLKKKIIESVDEYYKRITKNLEKEDVDLILCIGWMKIIPPSFLKKWENKCINVHPSLLPKYAGGMDLNVHKQVIDNKEKETGCTVHIITDEVDKGPIIAQKRCIVNENDTVEILKERVQNLEGICLIDSLYYYYNNLISYIIEGNNLGIVKLK